VYELTVITDGVTDLAGNSPVGARSITWIKADPLRATIGPIEPQHSTSGPGDIPIRFDRPVTGFELSDLRLTRDGAAVSLFPRVPDGGSVDDLPHLVGSGSAYQLRFIGPALLPQDIAGAAPPIEGDYELVLPADSGIVDDLGRPLSAAATATFVVDQTRPTGSWVAVTPDPRGTAVNSITVVFSEAVTGVDVSDFRLLRDGAPVGLAEATVDTNDDVTYTIGGLGPLTDLDGVYEISVAVSTSGIVDRAGNPLVFFGPELWTADVSPKASFGPVESPRSTAVDEVDVVFTEPVSGVGVDDFTLTRGGEIVDVSAASVTGSGTAWRLAGLAGMTAPPAEGTDSYVLRLRGGTASGIVDVTGHPLVADAGGVAASVGFEVFGSPTVSIDPITPQLRTTAVDTATVRFSHPVTGFDTADLRLRLNQDPVDTAGLTITDSGDGAVYTISGLDAVTGFDGDYDLTVEPASSGIADQFAQPIRPDTIVDPVSFTVDTSPPLVEILEPFDGQVALSGDRIIFVRNCTDHQSAITSCEARLDDGTTVDSGDTVPTDTPGTFTITLTATNGVGATSSDTVTFTVLSRIPVAVDDHYSTTTGTVLSVPFFTGVTVNDSDNDSSFTVELVTAPTDGAVELATNGAFTYTPDAGFEGTDTFTYRAVDSDGNASAATVTIDVTFAPPPTPPQPSGEASITVSDDTPNAGDTITVSGTGFPANAPVHLVLYGGPVNVGDTQTDGTGSFTTGATIPADTSTGGPSSPASPARGPPRPPST
jgi:hypothetical protein